MVCFLSSFPDIQELIILGIGGLSIVTSIVSSIAQYLKLAEKSEAHRIAYVSWEKFYNNVRFQLSLRKKDRENILVANFLYNYFLDYLYFFKSRHGWDVFNFSINCYLF